MSLSFDEFILTTISFELWKYKFSNSGQFKTNFSKSSSLMIQLIKFRNWTSLRPQKFCVVSGCNCEGELSLNFQ
jgi:hypothetical protein